ncbi:hypothetical protein SAMN05216578_102245 [Halopseudomonas formosensis]|uniref:Uncharacterized protein n=1 Tax=Halopseudomonas formosensis TaxID=1002526 RepID=A0A1I6AND4_9GAMM|nr:hypothetical protein [Halopseudomonas formosensis]SFQ70077.1 hypothetical protein SAMN05216578_102245 [Halopseudomonas formosensis]
MRPANAPLCLIPGTTHRSTLRIMQPTWVYKPVTSITAGAPVQLQVLGHGIQTDSWPCWLTGVQHMPELNRDPPRERPHRMRVVDADTLEINSISATGRQPRGGELRYQPPVDLTGCDVEMHLFDRPGGATLMTLGLGTGLTITGPGTIERVIGANQVIPPTASWYWLEVRYPDGTEHRYWEGPVTIGDA